MHTNRNDLFTTIRTEGAILPPDLLQRVAEGDREIGGLAPADYHLSGETLNEAVNRSWNRLTGAWIAFSGAVAKLPDTDSGTTVTREKWLLPLFQELGYGRLAAAKAVDLEGKSYPVSHRWQNSPIHLISFRLGLDKRVQGAKGASTISPHSLLQELLNRAADCLWGFVSNGTKLRILRDNKSLTRQAYVEFDLQAMMDGQVYPDFKLLWLLCHESRVLPSTETAAQRAMGARATKAAAGSGRKPAKVAADERDEVDRAEPDLLGEHPATAEPRPEVCWLEKWSQTAVKQGTRALDQLRSGVEKAIAVVGRGFLAYSANTALRDQLRAGTLEKQDYYRQLLRVVYRLIFLFVAEDRGLLCAPDADPKARERYTRYYSTRRLRDLAGSLRGTPHADLYRGLTVVFAKLDATGCAELALPALGSFLWSTDAIIDLSGCDLSNRDLLDAVRELAYAIDGNARRPVDYRNLGAEELGSIYESLLELHPDVNTDAGTFELRTAAGHERKTTGSYYTPSNLVNCLLDSALDPVLEEATKGGKSYEGRGDTAERRILSLKVCDPACGSGHFLIAAAHRIAKRLASVRTGDEEPSPEAYRHALRDVIGHCIYGVDLNPMAVELCKVSLWMEAMEPGKPLSFLDHRIQVGNSLIGATPAVLARGIPEEAFEPIEGDDKALCKAFKKQNKDERKGQMQLFTDGHRPWEHLGNLAANLVTLDSLSDETIDSVRLKQRRYEDLVNSSNYETGRLLADAWCAAFVWRKTKELDYPITEAIFRQIEKNPHGIAPWIREEIRKLARHYQFFHWHLAFPDVFRPTEIDSDDETGTRGWSGGFDLALGNPPWERVNLKEQEWFAERRPDIAAAKSSERKRLIGELEQQDPLLFKEYHNALRQADAEGHIIRGSGRYPLCGRGDINVYAIFAETMTTIVSFAGSVGCIVPSGIATDDTTRFFFRHIIESNTLRSLFDFENQGLFPGVHNSYKFCLLTMKAADRNVFAGATFVFFAHAIDDVGDPRRRFSLSPSDIARLNPNSFTCPVFRFARDAEITKQLHRRLPIFAPELGDGSSDRWNTEISRMFHSSEDSPLFETTPTDESLRLYEAKYFWQFDHRFATFDGHDVIDLSSGQKSDPFVISNTRYYISRSAVPPKFVRRLSPWLLSFRKIARSTDSRTLVSAITPECGIIDSATNVYISRADDAACLLASLNSFVVDYVARQKIGGPNMTVGIVSQLPMVPPSFFATKATWAEETSSLGAWVINRSLELAYTAWDLEAFAQGNHYYGPPFRWDEERRFHIRCELDAAYFHLYGISREDADYILETFPIVKRKDTEKYGNYRTRETILAIYDAMAEARKAGRHYQTCLDPPPGPPTDATGNFIPVAQWIDWPTHIHPPKPRLKAGAARQADGDLVLQVYAFLYVAGVAVEIETLRRAIVLMLNEAVRKAYLDGKTPGQSSVAGIVSLSSLRNIIRSQVKAGNLTADGEIDATAQVKPDPKNAPTADTLKATDIGQAAFRAADEARRALVSLRGRERILDQLAEDYDATATEPVRRG